MDRDRLKEIQTADLSESNVNEDFVYWLKTKGPGYLLIAMIVIASYLFFVRYQQGQSAQRAEAWNEYFGAVSSGLPASHEDVAKSFSDVDAIEGLGLISAADAYLQSIIVGKTVGSNADISTVLSEEDRTFYLEKADNLYKMIITKDDLKAPSSLLVVSALNGRAAVAEAKGDVESAKDFYEKVIVRISNQYPVLATQAQLRIDTILPLANPIVLPTDAEVAARNNQVLQRDPTPINSTIDSLTDITDSDGSQ